MPETFDLILLCCIMSGLLGVGLGGTIVFMHFDRKQTLSHNPIQATVVFQQARTVSYMPSQKTIVLPETDRKSAHMTDERIIRADPFESFLNQID